MTNDSVQKRAMRQYLLGHLSEEERPQFEKQYLADGELFEELMAAEDELIGCYLSDSCSESERTQIESHILHNREWRESVAFARSHVGFVSRETASYQPKLDPRKVRTASSESGDVPRVLALKTLAPAARRYIQPALWLLLIVAICWVWISNLQLRQRLDKQSAEQNDLRRQLEALRGQEANLQADLRQAQLAVSNQSDRTTLPLSSQGKIVVLTLASDLVRKAGSNEPLLLLHGATLVKLQLALETDAYASYAATLRTPEGVAISQDRDLKSQILPGRKHGVTLTLPSAGLTRGTYAVKLSGIDMQGQEVDLPSYAFHVER